MINSEKSSRLITTVSSWSREIFYSRLMFHTCFPLWLVQIMELWIQGLFLSWRFWSWAVVLADGHLCVVRWREEKRKGSLFLIKLDNRMQGILHWVKHNNPGRKNENMLIAVCECVRQKQPFGWLEANVYSSRLCSHVELTVSWAGFSGRRGEGPESDWINTPK